jgi:anti-anti-sigma regulatory factor
MSKPKATNKQKAAGAAPEPGHTAVPEAGQTAAPEGVTVILDHSLEIKDVQGMHRRLLAAVAGASNVTLDVSRLATVDTAGVQLLLALCAAVSKQGKSVYMRGDSPALTQALTALGLRDALGAKTGSEPL